MKYTVSFEKTLEEVIYRVYGTSKMLSEVLKIAPDLAYMPKVLVPGTSIELPDIPPPAAVRPTQKLWD